MSKRLHHIRTTDERRSDSLRLFAHDLNSPLTAIQLLAGTLRDEILDPAQRRDIIDILEAADMAGALMDGMASLVRLEGLDEDFTWFPLDVVEILREAIDRPALRRWVKLDLPREIPLSGDRMALERAFTDMLVNALRLVERRSVTVTAGEHDGHVLIRIHHPGPGIPEDLRLRLFELYGALELRQNRIPVSAAGLVYARMVIDQHGGSLAFEDGEDGGLNLVVRLPR
jgi:two-component system sensor histidine kinase KdpD